MCDDIVPGGKLRAEFRGEGDEPSLCRPGVHRIKVLISEEMSALLLQRYSRRYPYLVVNIDAV